MIIVMYDGSRLACNTVEFSCTGYNIIVDGCTTIPIIEVLRIIED